MRKASKNDVKATARRQRLQSLKVSPAFRDFVLDQLADVPSLRAQPMFGAVGLYSGEHFFGILAGEELYLKADQATRIQFVNAGGHPFTPYPGPAASMGYYSVPIGVLESAPDLMSWVKRSIAVARGTARRAR
jgi:DNA transformation protein